MERMNTYNASDAEPFIKYAAGNATVMGDVEVLAGLPLDMLADVLQQDDICLTSESAILDVSAKRTSHQK